jgi:FkbM family methyltransferase
MIIDKNYMLDRFAQLIAANDFPEAQPAQRRPLNPYRIKMAFPAWLRAVFFHHANPLYLLWGKSNLWKDRAQTTITYDHRHPMSTDFIKHCFEYDIRLDTREFFDGQDSEIAEFIDRKIKTFLTGCMPDIVPRAHTEAAQAFTKKIKYRHGFYQITLDGRTCYLPYNLFSFDVFHTRYGLSRLPAPVLKALAGRDFIDIGAFYGDSAIVFLPFQPRKIYAYEPVPATCRVLQKTIRKNAPGLIVPIQKGMGHMPMSLPIALKSSASSLRYLFGVGCKTKEIEIDTIDNECRDRNVGLIKMDVEGFEYYVVQGGLETIRRDRPVMIISVYHTGVDFFEIMPLLRECCPAYKFIFVDLSPADAIAEKMIIAYVE